MADGDGAIGSSFSPVREGWLAQGGRVRNRLRQEMIGRQLDAHIGQPPASVLDVGAGQGTQSIRLARAGYQVLAVEPDAHMRSVFIDALEREPAEVRARVSLSAESVTTLDTSCDGQRFDAVLLIGVLMYVEQWALAFAQCAARVADGGILAVAARTVTSALWRPAARQDWKAAAQALEQFDLLPPGQQAMPYINEIGAPAWAQSLDALQEAGRAAGLTLEQWYGVRVAVDLAEADPAPPQDEAEWENLLRVEQRLGSLDPFRHLAQLAHLIWRRSS